MSLLQVKRICYKPLAPTGLAGAGSGCGALTCGGAGFSFLPLKSRSSLCRDNPIADAGEQTFESRDALQLAATNDFDLLVSDIGLPDGDGFELLKEIRQAYR
jgi:hypothetical protein